MISESSIYGAIEEHAAKVGALAFPLILWPAGGYFVGKSGKVGQLTPEQGAMIGLLCGIGHAWWAKKKGDGEEVTALAEFASAEEGVLALPAELPDNVVSLDDYRGACSCGDYGAVDDGLPGRPYLGLAVAVGLMGVAYWMFFSEKEDVGTYIDKLSRERW